MDSGKNLSFLGNLLLSQPEHFTFPETTTSLSPADHLLPLWWHCVYFLYCESDFAAGINAKTCFISSTTDFFLVWQNWILCYFSLQKRPHWSFSDRKQTRINKSILIIQISHMQLDFTSIASETFEGKKRGKKQKNLSPFLQKMLEKILKVKCPYLCDAEEFCWVISPHIFSHCTEGKDTNGGCRNRIKDQIQGGLRH